MNAEGMLLGPADPSPVEWVNEDSTLQVHLLCGHAGQAVPSALGGLGLPPEALDDHIGWDIGAEALARAVADRLAAPLVLQRYSRLVIDCNRPPDTPQSVPAVSDGGEVAANARATELELAARRREIFDPLDRTIADGFARHPRRAAFSIHAFTISMTGQDRAWHAGFLARADEVTAQALIAHVGGAKVALAEEALVLGLNEPYEIEDGTDGFIPRHAEPRGLIHSLIEIRNDQLRDAAGGGALG